MLDIKEKLNKRFLINDDTWKNFVTKTVRIFDNYLVDLPHSCVLVAMIADDNGVSFTHTVREIDASTNEFKETIIDINETTYVSLERISLGSNVKTRYSIPDYDGVIWHIDIFEYENEGTGFIELELPSPNSTIIDIPSFVGEEVKDNVNLGFISRF